MSARNSSYLIQEPYDRQICSQTPRQKIRQEKDVSSIQFEQLNATQRLKIFELFKQSELFQSCSTRPGTAYYNQELNDIFQQYLKSEMQKKDSKLLPLIVSHSENNTSKNDESLRQKPQEDVISHLDVSSDKEKDSLTYKYQTFTKQTNVTNKKESKRYGDHDPNESQNVNGNRKIVVTPQIAQSIIAHRYKTQYENVGSDANDVHGQEEQFQHPSSPKVKEKVDKECNDFWKSFEQFLNCKDFQGKQALGQESRSHHLQMIPEDHKEQENFEHPEKISIVQLRHPVEEGSSVESKNADYPNLTVYDFAKAWEMSRSSSTGQVPFISKGKSQKKCCSFLRRNTPLISAQMKQEKSIIQELSSTPFDVNNEFHRNMLYSVQHRFFPGQQFKAQGNRWVKLGFSSQNPVLDLGPTGVFGLIQIIGLITIYQEMIKSQFDLQRIYSDFKLCYLLLQLSNIVVELLSEGRLDGLIVEYKSCINGVNHLLAALTYNITHYCEQKKSFEPSLIQQLLATMKKKKDIEITQMTIKFTKNYTEYSKNF